MLRSFARQAMMVRKPARPTSPGPSDALLDQPAAEFRVDQPTGSPLDGFAQLLI